MCPMSTNILTILANFLDTIIPFFSKTSVMTVATLGRLVHHVGNLLTANPQTFLLYHPWKPHQHHSPRQSNLGSSQRTMRPPSHGLCQLWGSPTLLAQPIGAREVRKVKDKGKLDFWCQDPCNCWNRGVCKSKASECKYRHVCQGCGGSHRIDKCKKPKSGTAWTSSWASMLYQRALMGQWI